MTLDWDHFSLAVRDVDAAVAFFSEGLGFSVAFEERGMTGQISSMLGLADASCDLVQMDAAHGGPRLELIAFHGHDHAGDTARPVAPGMAHVAFRVQAFDETVAHLVSLGARMVGQVTQFGDGRSIYLSTPFGAFLEIEELIVPAHATQD